MKLYTTDWCVACETIKVGIAGYGLEVEVIDVDIVRKLPAEVRSVPTLHHNGKYFRGAISIFKHLRGLKKDDTMSNT